MEPEPFDINAKPFFPAEETENVQQDIRDEFQQPGVQMEMIYDEGQMNEVIEGEQEVEDEE